MYHGLSCQLQKSFTRTRTNRPGSSENFGYYMFLCLIWIQADAELLTVTWSIWIRMNLFYIEIWIRSYIYDNDQRYRLEGQADTDDQNILKYERVWGG